MPFIADLHLHSTASDGVLDPASLMHLLAEYGIEAASLTDHDTTDGAAEAREASEGLGIDFLSGIELSATDNVREIHVLGYGLDPDHQVLDEHRRETYEIRRQRLIDMTARLKRLGHPISFDAVLEQAKDGMPGRPHIARAMVDAGIVPDVAEAFRTYLSEGGAAFIPKPVLHIRRAIDLIHRAGGAAVLAHPAHAFTDHKIRDLVRMGLDGIEVSHPSHTSDLEQYYRGIARRFSLIPTGGSDYHGSRPEDALTLGRFGVPLESLQRLRERAETYSRSNSDSCPAS